MVTLIDPEKTSNEIQDNSNSSAQPTRYNKTDANNYDELFEMMLFYYHLQHFQSEIKSITKKNTYIYQHLDKLNDRGAANTKPLDSIDAILSKANLSNIFVI